MAPTSAEASVTRSYLDYLIGVPWKKKGKIKSDDVREYYNWITLLEEDFNVAPIHITLDETALINPEIVDTSTVNKNTYFKYSENI